MAAEIKKCSCKHEVQDKLYGKGMRVMNPTQKKEWRCTACGAQHK